MLLLNLVILMLYLRILKCFLCRQLTTGIKLLFVFCYMIIIVCEFYDLSSVVGWLVT